MGNIAVGYVRVSTDEQADEGVSMALQTVKIRQYCELNDLELVGIYGDPGISAKSTTKRPGITTVMALVSEKRIDHVVTYKLDRLVRNTSDALEIAREMNAHDVALHSICEKLDTKSAIGEFFFTLMAALAQMERRLIAERTSAALQHKSHNNERVGRYAPVGKKFGPPVADDRGNMVTPVVDDPDFPVVVHLAHSLRAQGHSYSKIAMILAGMGYFNQAGKMFSAPAIMKILRLPVSP